ncbi:pyridoxine/pyridoxamine 5'-phosphate oxidase [Drosophila nasuta]|uniref:pyridoxine/pyridoxamine 5'-phosphate oxidase n=1 Tax=Drosophila nasuta TaxID=42062 RepID=UPI00295E80E7|nr:pyridoxine/pyridoxamine 5'-phosphate oxidase [Drosophila nasuta]
MNRMPVLKQRLRVVALLNSLLPSRSQPQQLQPQVRALPESELDVETHQAIREPYSILQSWLFAAQHHTSHCKSRVACLATVDATGQPVTRLTNVEQINPSGITFYTALGSRQAGEISTNPHVSLHFHWPEMERSVHIAGIASRVSALQAQHQFWKYPRHVQLSMSGIQESNKDVSVYNKIKQLFSTWFTIEEEPLPAPRNWGGFQLKPTLYEFFDSTRGIPYTRCMRFRRCLAMPRGMRNRRLNADCYDWIFENCFN